jgi:hypothetical protein
MVASSPSKSLPVFVESPASAQRLDAKSSAVPIDAGLVAGVFFGRLTRRFGYLPSRRISGPSAEFISVNGWTAGAVVADMPLFAPMNNPNLRLCRGTTWRTGFFNEVLS